MVQSPRTLSSYAQPDVSTLIPKELDVIARADNIDPGIFRNSSAQELLEVTHAVTV